jgi:hypothetical protein
MHIKDIIVENEPQQRRPKLSMKALDVKAKEELTDKIFTYPGGPKQTEYFNIPFTATIQLAKTEYYNSNQISVGAAVDKAVKYYQDNPDQAEKEKNNKPDRKFATANMKLNKKADPDAPKKTRGAQLGNQNAFKGGPGMMSAIGKTISSIKDFGKDGYVSGVKNAMSSGSDLRKSVSDRYTKMARKPNQAPKDVFNS